MFACNNIAVKARRLCGSILWPIKCRCLVDYTQRDAQYAQYAPQHPQKHNCHPHEFIE